MGGSCAVGRWVGLTIPDRLAVNTEEDPDVVD